MSVSVDARTRLFARVKERLPIRLRTLTVEDAAELSRRLCVTPTSSEPTAATGEVEESPSWEHAALSAILQRLDRLERKVQRIAATVGAVDEADGEWVMGETANLSGGGLAVRAPSAPTEGTHIEIDLSLPGDPPAQIRAVGRVVYALHPNGVNVPLGLHQLGIAFTAIHDADRELIVRYTFRLQRAQLREGRIDPA
jgi:hypothetical protein